MTEMMVRQIERGLRTASGELPGLQWHGQIALPSWLTALFVLLSAGSSSAQPGGQPVRYTIIVTGGELLAGAYADGHTQFLARTLRPLGLKCVGSMSVDDRKADILAALRFGSDKAPLLLVTGGLGPTDNDITRETLCEFSGIALREDPEVLRAMTERFGRSAERLRANLRRQTQVPTRGTHLKNPHGTAVGLVFETDDTVIVALPGPPRELQTMVRDELVPYLGRRFGTRRPGRSLTIRFVGLGQSQVDETLKNHLPLPDEVTVSSQFEGGRVDFTFSLPDDTSQGRARLEQLKQGIIEHLGDYVYAVDGASLEQCVVGLLAERRATLAVAEVGSGGSLAAALTGAGGAPRVLAGAYVAPTEDKLRRLLKVADGQWPVDAPSGQTAERLAAEVAATSKSSWAVAVGEVRQDAAGARHVEVAFKPPQAGPQSRRLTLRGTGQYARQRLVTRLLDRLRRELR